MLLGASVWYMQFYNKSAHTDIPTENQPVSPDQEVQKPYIPQEMGELKPPLPDSFKGVPMKTYRSDVGGFEITYPEEWDGKAITSKEVPSMNEFGEVLRYGISPKLPVDPESWRFGPMIHIRSFTNDHQYKNNEDSIPPNGYISINGIRAEYSTGEEGGSIYSFETNRKIYSIQINDSAIMHYRLHKEEAEWVLSTFRIIE